MSVKEHYERRYTQYGKVAHLLNFSCQNVTAACGVWAWSQYGWYGSGSQTEYDTADALPLCKRCEAAVTR